MSRLRLLILLGCGLLLFPSVTPGAGPDIEPEPKFSPALRRMLDDEAGPYRVWIFFRDKGLPDRASRAAAVANVAASYNSRAVERRRLRGRSARSGGPLFDVRDLPVHERYVDRVEATGAQVRIRSRWLNAVSAVATGAQLDAIEALPQVTKVQPVARSRTPGFLEQQSTESAPADYGRSTAQLTQINLIALHQAGYTGQGVIVGVLDSGFRRDHQAFNQPGHVIDVLAEYDFVDDDPDTSNEPGDFATQHDHGTVILGTLASYYPGQLVGGAYDASFVLAKTEDLTGEYQAEEDNYVAGLEFAEANGADMTTSSLGYIDWYTQADLDGETAVTTIAVNTASDLGVHTVTAAGNDGHDSNPATSSLIAPSDAFSVITVGAVGPSGTTATLSSDGPTADGRVKPEVLALGLTAESVSPDNTTGYGLFNGTSLSTPLVASAVACLIQAHPSLSVQAMRDALFISADYDPGGLGFDPEHVRGYGIIDAAVAESIAVDPAGRVLFGNDVYSCSDSVVITVRDHNIPGDPPTITAELSSDTETVPETVTLTRIEPGIPRYQATLPTTSVSPFNGDGLLSLSHGDLLYAEYTDADDGAGGFNITVQDTATADCQGPAISAVQAGQMTGTTARVTWTTDEPADSAVTHGLSPPGSTTETDGELVTSHDLSISGLQECTRHAYSVASADVFGNSTTDDNGGAYYTLETLRDVNPAYPSTDTPLPISDNTTFDSVIAVANSKLVADVDVTVDIAHTRDGDLALSLIPPVGTAISLVDHRGGTGSDFNGTVFDDEASTPITAGSPPYTGSFQPESPLGAADGIDSRGSWTLRVSDDRSGRTGTLNGWTLSLTFLGQPCVPHASCGSASPESDLCSGGGAGAGDGFWDAGEQVQFDVLVENDGAGPLNGAWAEVTPLTPGVVMLDWLASYPDLVEGAVAGSLAPHFTARLPAGVACGDPIDFAVTIHANQGSWTATVSRNIGDMIPQGGVALSEDFEAGLPGGWSVVDGFGDAQTWYLDNAADPAGCSNTDPGAPVAGNWMAADSDCAGLGVPLDEQLVTPPIDLGVAVTATVDFDHYLDVSQNEVADVDVRSSLTGGSWINVARWNGADTGNPEHAQIDITAQAAGASDVEIRWHYYDTDLGRFWYVDNVSVSYTTQGTCVTTTCTAAPSAPPSIPDGANGGAPIAVDRLDPGGTQLLVSWDDQCSPVTAKILYGPLGGVATYSIGGAECGIAQPHVWDPVAAGDLWFVVVSGDGAGVEGSWGLASPSNERNGLAGSGTCGSSIKDVSATCP